MKLLCPLLAVMLAGCATTARPPEQAAPVPAARMFYKAPAGADAAVVVVRDDGIMGRGCNYALYVNRQLAATFAAGETARFQVQSGDVLLSAARDPAGSLLCSTSADPTYNTTEAVLASGKTKTYRLAIPKDGGVRVMASDL